MMTRAASVMDAHLAAAAKHSPRLCAVTETNRRRTVSLTWRDLDAATQAVRQRTREAVTEDRDVALAVPVANTLAGVVGLLGALRTGFPVLPYDRKLPAAESQRLFDLAAQSYAAVYCLGQKPGDAHPVRHPHADARGAGIGLAAAADYLLPSGGTSGRLALAAGQLQQTVADGMFLLLRRTGWRTGQVQLVAGPLHHSAPFSMLMRGILDLNTIVVQGAFDAANAIGAVDGCRVEWMQLTPAHLRRLLDEGGASRARLSSLRGLLHTAGPCDDQTKRGWIHLVGPERLFETYGATEQIGMTLARADEWLERPGTVGRGFMTQIRVTDQGGAALPAGEIGEIYLRRGRGRSTGPGAAAIRRTVDGFETVGDAGYIDREGYLYLTGRESGLIIVGGSNVYPEEIERAILALPQVADVAVVSRPHPVLGAVPHALVVPHRAAGLTKASLVEHCRRELAVHKRPRSISFVANLPRTESGKLQRWRLSDAWEG